MAVNGWCLQIVNQVVPKVEIISLLVLIQNKLLFKVIVERMH